MDEPFSYFDDSPLGFFEPKPTGTGFDLADVDGSFPTTGYYDKGADQDLLTQTLLKARKDGKLLADFNFKTYIGKKVVYGGYYDYMGYMGYDETTVYEPIGINTKNEPKDDDLLSFRTRLNTKIGGTVDPSPSIGIKPDIDSETAHYTITFCYVENTAESDDDEYINVITRDFSDNGKVTNSERRIMAIRFETTIFMEFDKLCQQLGIDWMDRSLKFHFKNAYDKISSLEQRSNFYTQVPMVFLETFDSSTLFFDLLDLLVYDDLTWFSDNSSAMIKVLSSILSKEGGMVYLYHYFNNYPWIVKEIYDHLDSTGEATMYDGQEMPNKSIFASMIMVICNDNAQGYNEERMQSWIRFDATEDHRIDSNVVFADDEEGKYNLTQETYVTTTRYGNMGGSMDGSASHDFGTIYESSWVQGTTHHLHPLDMVTLTIEGEGKQPMDIIVPALFVKDMAYHREWEEINKMIRIGIDIFIIIISIVTLVTGAGPLLMTLSFIDLGLATADLGIQAFEKEIRKLDGGPEFLDAWETIYFIGGIVTALPLVGTVLRNGAKILLKVSGKVQQQVISMLKYSLKLVRTFPKFVRNQFDIISDFIAVLGKTAGTKMQLLANEGMLLIKGIREGEKTLSYSLVYRGVVLRTDSLKNIINEISDIVQKGKNALGKYLDQLYFSKAGTGGAFKYLSEKTTLRMVCQEEAMSCAAACIRQLAKENGKLISEEVARVAAGTDATGTILNNIGPALVDVLKIDADQVVEGFFKFSTQIPDPHQAVVAISQVYKKPWIASLKPPGGVRHSIIVDKVVDDIVHIRDPWDPAKGYGAANGVEATMKLDDFVSFWKGSLHHFVLIK